jgi:HEAT repeat protein
VRGAAIAALAGSQSGDAVPLINHALYDPEPHVRLRAAQGLWVARGPDATPRLQQIARSDRAAEVRAGVARLLDGDAEVGPQPRASLHPQAVDR